MKKAASLLLAVLLALSMLIPIGLSEPKLEEAGFSYTLDNGSAQMIRYSGLSDAVIVPATVQGYPVTAIGSRAFSGGVNSVVIPEGVTSIADEAFYGCSLLERVMIPDSVNTIAANAFIGPNGDDPLFLTIYGSLGSTAQLYARKYGISFGDANVYRLFYGEIPGDAVKTDADPDDPFAVFTKVPGIAPVSEDFAYPLDKILHCLWPQEGLFRAGAGVSQGTFARSFREHVLENGGELAATLSLQPGAGIDPTAASLMKSLTLRLREKRQNGKDACSMELMAGGLSPISISASADGSAVYLTSNLLEGDILSVTRDELRTVLLEKAESLAADMCSIGDDGKIAGGILRLAGRQELIQKWMDADGQTAAYLLRMEGKGTQTELPARSGLNDTAANCTTYHFTKEDILDFFLLPPCNSLLRIFSLPMNTLAENKFSMDSLKRFLTADTHIRNNWNELLKIPLEGDLSILRDASGSVVAIDGSIQCDLKDQGESLLESLAIRFQMNKKTGAEGVRHSLNVKLTSVLGKDAAIQAGKNDAELANIKGQWLENGPEIKEGTLQVTVNPPYDLHQTVEAGLQFKQKQSGTIENWSNTHQFNFYFKDSKTTGLMSLVSEGKGSGNRIDQSASLYLNDLNHPVVTIRLATEEVPLGGLMDGVLHPESVQVQHPIRWSLKALQDFMTKHNEAIFTAVSTLTSLLPPEAASILGGGF